MRSQEDTKKIQFEYRRNRADTEQSPPRCAVVTVPANLNGLASNRCIQA